MARLKISVEFLEINTWQESPARELMREGRQGKKTEEWIGKLRDDKKA